ncbi:MAG: sugar ABC transporter permease [Actinomycetota bacterium]|nr:sugar ABC transporter permease [Actinomycetota bacterium]
MTGPAARFLAPYAVGTTLLVLIPALLTLGYAFTDHTGIASPGFNGLDNLRRLWADPLFLASVQASAFHVAVAVPLRLLTATAVGLLLAAPRSGGRWYRTAVYLPTVVPDVALALLFLWLLNPVYGPLNQLLGAAGLSGPNWLSSPWGARVAVIMLLAFPIGEAFVVVVATRRHIDGRLYEAAALDGCGRWKALRRITLPLLAPVLVLLAVRDTAFVLHASFVPAYLLTDGGPDNATLYLPLYIFDQSFEFFGFGYGAMLTLVLLGFTVLLVALQVALVRRWRVLR